MSAGVQPPAFSGAGVGMDFKWNSSSLDTNWHLYGMPASKAMAQPGMSQCQPLIPFLVTGYYPGHQLPCLPKAFNCELVFLIFLLFDALENFECYLSGIL